MIPSFEEEEKLWQKGLSRICGLDEVGRGSWAGPLVVAAVILPKNFQVPKGFGDSKKVKPRQREIFSDLIKRESLAWSIAETPVTIINKVGIGKATQIAFRKALKTLPKKPDFILIDAYYIDHVSRKNQRALVKGDEKSASIAAASIIAKVYRDGLMKKLHYRYPNWGFAKHKGYGTKNHQEAIKQFGFCQIHRQSFNLSYLVTS